MLSNYEKPVTFTVYSKLSTCGFNNNSFMCLDPALVTVQACHFHKIHFHLFFGQDPPECN